MSNKIKQNSNGEITLDKDISELFLTFINKLNALNLTEVSQDHRSSGDDTIRHHVATNNQPTREERANTITRDTEGYTAPPDEQQGVQRSSIDSTPQSERLTSIHRPVSQSSSSSGASLCLNCGVLSSVQCQIVTASSDSLTNFGGGWVCLHCVQPSSARGSYISQSSIKLSEEDLMRYRQRAGFRQETPSSARESYISQSSTSIKLTDEDLMRYRQRAGFRQETPSSARESYISQSSMSSIKLTDEDLSRVRQRAGFRQETPTIREISAHGQHTSANDLQNKADFSNLIPAAGITGGGYGANPSMASQNGCMYPPSSDILEQETPLPTPKPRVDTKEVPSAQEQPAQPHQNSRQEQGDSSLQALTKVYERLMFHIGNLKTKQTYTEGEVRRMLEDVREEMIILRPPNQLIRRQTARDRRAGIVFPKEGVHHHSAFLKMAPDDSRPPRQSKRRTDDASGQEGSGRPDTRSVRNKRQRPLDFNDGSKKDCESDGEVLV